MKTFLLLCGLLLAADCQSGTYVVVSLNAPALSGTVTSVQLQLSLAGKPGSTTPTLTEAGGGPISFPTSAVLNIPSGEGSLTVNAVALGAGGVQLATGTASGTVSHGHTLELNLTLMSASTGALMADVTSKDFGGVVVGSTSSPATVTITNSGSATSSAISTSIGGTDAAMFGIDTDSCNGMTLAAGATCMLTMHYAPTAVASHVATLKVSATVGGDVTVALTGMAIGPGSLASDLTTKDFGTVVSGMQSAATTFTISNSTMQPSGPISATVGGADPSQFAITDNCAGHSVGAPCTLVVKFTPTSYGTKHATITISANPGGGFVLTLTGTGQDSVALDVTVNGTGTVTSGSIINCGSGNTTCSATITRTSTTPMVTLTETPGSGQQFGGWSGGVCSGTATTCVVTMSAAKSVTASFSPKPVLYYTFDGNGNNTGSVANMNMAVTGGTYVAGKFGMALQTSGTGYAQATGAKATLGTYPKVTISMWIHDYVTPGGNSTLFDCNNRSTAPYGGIQLFSTGPSMASLLLSSSSTTYVPNGSPNPITVGAAGAWHNLIVSYNGTSTSAGGGGITTVYVDDVVTNTIANDASNNPIFNNGIADTLTLGYVSATIDDVKIYDTVFTQAQQCTEVIGGTWNGSSCTLP